MPFKRSEGEIYDGIVDLILSLVNKAAKSPPPNPSILLTTF